MKKILMAFLLIALAFSFGCGKKDEDVRAENNPPIAKAGPDQQVGVGETVSLNGSALDIDGEQLAYIWSFVSFPSGSAATLSGSDSASAFFTADLEGVYTLAFNVADEKGGSSVSQMKVTAVAIDLTAPDPIATAGDGHVSASGKDMVLYDSGVLLIKNARSHFKGEDQAAYDAGFFPAIFGSFNSWQSTTTGMAMNSDGSWAIDFSSLPLPEGNSRFQPLFIDGSGGEHLMTEFDKDDIDAFFRYAPNGDLSMAANKSVTSDGSLLITVPSADETGTINTAPIASVGADQQVDTGSTVKLSGAGTDSESDTLIFAWSLLSSPEGSAAVLAGNAETASFTADLDGTYVVSLNVSDGIGGSSTAKTTITAATSDHGIVVANSTNLLLYSTGVLAIRNVRSHFTAQGQEAYDNGGTSSVAGSFNSWQPTATGVTAGADGNWIIDFSLLSLPEGNSRFQSLLVDSSGVEHWMSEFDQNDVDTFFRVAPNGDLSMAIKKSGELFSVPAADETLPQ